MPVTVNLPLSRSVRAGPEPAGILSRTGACGEAASHQRLAGRMIVWFGYIYSILKRIVLAGLPDAVGSGFTNRSTLYSPGGRPVGDGLKVKS